VSANGNGQFRDDEVVVRRSKINGEWVENRYVKVGGKLRVLHQENEQVSILTEILRFEPDYVVCRATVQTAKGTFSGIGVATLKMDSRIGDAIVSLSETRAVARACRHAGYAMDSCGAEELAFTEMEHFKEPQSAFTNGSGGAEKSKPQDCGIDSPTADAGEEQNGNGGARKSKAQGCAIDRPGGSNGSAPQSCGNGTVTSAQVRALYALTKRARYSDEDIASLLAPLSASTFQELTRESASQLIAYLQTEVAA
jgi:hypothetical protein